MDIHDTSTHYHDSQSIVTLSAEMTNHSVDTKQHTSVETLKGIFTDCMLKYKKLSYRRETARQLPT